MFPICSCSPQQDKEKIVTAVFREKIKGWFGLSRPPFHTVGVLPFILGTFLAWKVDGVFSNTIFMLGVLAVILILLSTYHAGEYFDHEEDKISKTIFHSMFAGGSGVIPAGIVSRKVPLWTSLITFTLAAAIGIILQFVLKTGPCTLLLGCLGAFPGFFYSTRPIRLVERGIGELCIGFCYGWLPVASGFYIQTGHISPIIHWIGVSIGLTIFNVILLNEFPDFIADSTVGKRNLLVRMGKKKGEALYIVISVLAWMAMFLSIAAGIPGKAVYFYLPILILSAGIITMILLRKHRDQKILEILCGLNIAVNLGTTTIYILAYL
jgi:1,4-dihydroxy-2-naphthoate octaprenyltransferase